MMVSWDLAIEEACFLHLIDINESWGVIAAPTGGDQITTTTVSSNVLLPGEARGGMSLRGRWYFFFGSTAFIFLTAGASFSYGPAIFDAGLVVGIFLFGWIALGF